MQPPFLIVNMGCKSEFKEYCYCNVRVKDPSKVAIDGAKLSLHPGEGCLVVHRNIISSVLQLGDEHQPHVDDHVGTQIQQGHCGRSILVTEQRKRSNSQDDTNITQDNIRTLFFSKEGRPRRKVVDVLLALELLVARHILCQIEWPTQHQMLEDGERSSSLTPRQLYFAAGRGHMDLILANVVRVQVVTKIHEEGSLVSMESKTKI